MSSIPVIPSPGRAAGAGPTAASVRRPRGVPRALLGLLLGLAAPLVGAAETPASGSPFTPAIEEFVKSFKPGGQDFTGQATTPGAGSGWSSTCRTRSRPAAG
jgi:hypothetical protein